MSYRWVAGPCADCGGPVNRRIDHRRPRICMDCAVERMAEQVRQAHAKSGPMYIATLYKRRDALIRELRAAGIPTTGLTTDEMLDELTAPRLSNMTRRHLEKVAAGATDRVPRRSRTEANADKRKPKDTAAR